MSETTTYNDNGIFPTGEKNTAYAQYFTGQSYLATLLEAPIKTANVTFEPGCRNHWHIHHKGGQILIVHRGEGWYQEWGKAPRRLKAGDIVHIPAEVKHWHGATSDSWFAHLALEVPAEHAAVEWMEPVNEEDYAQLD